MDSRYFVTLEKFLKEGDKAAVYTHGGKFVALIEFVGEYFYCEKELGWDRLYPYRIKFKMIYESKNPQRISFSTQEITNKAKWSNPNLIDDITFITDKSRTWNIFFRVSIIRITEEDFETIHKALMKN